MLSPHGPIILLFLILFSGFQIILGKTFPYCKGKYAPTDTTCSIFKFARKTTAGANCSDLPPGTSAFPDISSFPPPPPLSSGEKHVAEVITNIFENSEEAFAYDAIEDIGDARGYTAGRVGFTTGTGDVQALVELYNRMSKSSQAKALAGYLPELTRLSSLSRCDPARASVDGLKGFDTAWKNAAHKDPEFARAQDTLNEQMYLTPGRRYAALNNVTSPLGQAIFYDTIIQHGWQITEPDINLPRILTLTGPRQKEESEAAYLGRFLHTRRTLLCCYPDNTWPKAADRISDLQSVLKAGGLFMRKTIHLPSYNKNVKVPKQKGLRLRI